MGPNALSSSGGLGRGLAERSALSRLSEHVHQGRLLVEGNAGGRSSRAARSTPTRCASYLDKRLDDLESGDSIRLTRSGRAALERYRDRLIHEAGERRLVPKWIHADFCPDNIIVGDGVVTVLDFMMAKTGTVLPRRLAPLYAPRRHEGEAVVQARGHRPAAARSTRRFRAGARHRTGRFSRCCACNTSSVTWLPCRERLPSRAARLYTNRIHRRHRNWLAQAAGLDRKSWTR